jgi:hypothetical protein
MSNSQTILPTTTHPGDGSSQTVRGEKFKGDGYYSRTDGIHTVQITLTNFVGVIEIEGTLGVDPQDPFYTNCNDGTDWSPVLVEQCTCIDTTGCMQMTEAQNRLEYTTPTTTVKTWSFTGNYTWLRAFISNWTAGTINNIKLNH